MAASSGSSTSASSHDTVVIQAHMNATTALEALRRELLDAEALEALKTIVKLLDNVIGRPGDFKTRSIRRGNPNFHAKVGRHPSAVALLEAAGFSEVLDAGIPHLHLSAMNESMDRTLAVRAVVATAIQGLGDTIGPPPEVDAALLTALEASKAEFDPFRPIVTRVEPQPRSVAVHHTPPVHTMDAAIAVASQASSSPVPTHAAASPLLTSHFMSATERKLAALEQRKQQLAPFVIPERSTIVTTVSALAAAAKAVTATLPEVATPKPAAAAVKPASGTGMMAMLARARAERAEADPAAKSDASLISQALKAKEDKARQAEQLQTRAMRELHRLEKASVYKQAVIRVQFPDQTVVQGCFHPDEPIGNVYDWVASCLHSPLPFFLFTSPPFAVIEGSDTLNALKLVPAARLYLSWGDKKQRRSSAGPPPVTNYLRPELQAELDCEAASSTSVLEAAVHVPTSVSLAEEPGTPRV